MGLLLLMGNTGTTFTGALDTLGTGLESAWSVGRRLRAAYNGAIIRVRRSSDNTEQDFSGSGTTGAVDAAAVAAFCGVGNGFLTTIYDQSGNARNLTQSSTTVQPQVVASGVASTQNSRLWCDFAVASPKRMSVAASTAIYKFIHTTGGTVYHIAKCNNTAAGKVLWGTHIDQTWASPGMSTYFNSSENPSWLVNRINTSGSPATGNTVSVAIGGLDLDYSHLASYLIDPDNGTANSRFSLWLDRSLRATTNASTSTPFDENSQGNLQIGSLPTNNSLPFDGSMGELVIWSGDQTANRTIWESSAKTFWGTA